MSLSTLHSASDTRENMYVWLLIRMWKESLVIHRKSRILQSPQYYAQVKMVLEGDAATFIPSHIIHSSIFYLFILQRSAGTYPSSGDQAKEG